MSYVVLVLRQIRINVTMQHFHILIYTLRGFCAVLATDLKCAVWVERPELPQWWVNALVLLPTCGRIRHGILSTI